MNVKRLVEMANDIASYFQSEPNREAAVAGVASHITRFWTPRMRAQIVGHREQGGAELSELAAAGIARLAPRAETHVSNSPTEAS